MAMTPMAIEAVKAHLGGESVLCAIGARSMVADHDHVCFCLGKPNPNGVRTVVISSEPHDLFRMECFGSIGRGMEPAPLISAARDILPENLATVLGKLTGIEFIHHRHF